MLSTPLLLNQWCNSHCQYHCSWCSTSLPPPLAPFHLLQVPCLFNSPWVQPSPLLSPLLYTLLVLFPVVSNNVAASSCEFPTCYKPWQHSLLLSAITPCVIVIASGDFIFFFSHSCHLLVPTPSLCLFDHPAPALVLPCISFPPCIVTQPPTLFALLSQTVILLHTCFLCGWANPHICLPP